MQDSWKGGKKEQKCSNDMWHNGCPKQMNVIIGPPSLVTKERERKCKINSKLLLILFTYSFYFIFKTIEETNL